MNYLIIYRERPLNENLFFLLVLANIIIFFFHYQNGISISLRMNKLGNCSKRLLKVIVMRFCMSRLSSYSIITKIFMGFRFYSKIKFFKLSSLSNDSFHYVIYECNGKNRINMSKKNKHSNFFLSISTVKLTFQGKISFYLFL